MDDMRVKTDDNELTLKEMSSSLPDTSAVMEMVGHSWWHLIYAARGGNWALAQYYADRVAKLSRKLAVLRPKHKERLELFQANALRFVVAAIQERNLAKLEETYATATDLANHLHADSGYPYVKWVLPEEAPKGLQLEPVEEAIETPEDGSDSPRADRIAASVETGG